jgi:tetratricopeptide (TPR) repeat protein
LIPVRCAVISLLLAGCAAQGHLEPTSGALKHEGSAVVLLMTPDVQLSEITAGGLSEPNAEWTAQGLGNVSQALADNMLGRNAAMLPYAPPVGDAARTHDHQQIMKLHRAVGVSIIQHKYFEPLLLPTKKDVFDWGLGPDVQMLRDDYNAHYALFVYLRDSYSSPGRVAMMVALAALGVGVQGGYPGGLCLVGGPGLRRGRVVQPPASWHRRPSHRGARQGGGIRIADGLSPVRRIRHLGIVALLVLGCSSCATVGPMEDIQPGERPSIESDEAGLWMYMDRVEKAVASSGRVVTDEALNDYVGEIVCRLSPVYCRDIRIHIVRTPHFNATMAPNGYMQIWTGLMLRTRNEAQLAYVLGHEIGHFQRRHSIQRWRDARNKTDFGAILQVATAAAGVGYAGSLAQLAVYASILAFSRDQEREADDVGFAVMAKAGYDPEQAAQIWEALLEERDASDKPDQLVFFATHPSTEERITTLRERARAMLSQGFSGDTGAEAYRRIVGPFRDEWLRDEFRKRQFAETEVVMNRLLDDDEQDGEIRYMQGEFYRMRDEEGDEDRAIEAYETALLEDGTPPETHRSLGLVYWQAGRDDEAYASFEEYLRAAPRASDRKMIESYMTQLDTSQ